MTDITTTQSIELFRRALEGGNYAERTVRAYVGDVERFVAWLERERVDWDTPRRLSRIDLVEYLGYLSAEKATGVTRVRKLASLRKFCSFLEENGIIAGNPAETVKAPRKERRDPQVLYANEYKALLYEARGDARDYAMLQLFLQTGLRVGELVSLTLGDVDLKNKTLHVRQGKGRKDRTLPLENQAVDALTRYLAVRDRVAAEGEGALFVARNGTSMDSRTVRYRIQKYVRAAGIRKKASVHTLRHTYATHKVDKGMTLPTLQQLLGHRKMETTYRYVHLAKATLRAEQEATSL